MIAKTWKQTSCTSAGIVGQTVAHPYHEHDLRNKNQAVYTSDKLAASSKDYTVWRKQSWKTCICHQSFYTRLKIAQPLMQKTRHSCQEVVRRRQCVVPMPDACLLDNRVVFEIPCLPFKGSGEKKSRLGMGVCMAWLSSLSVACM